MADDMTTTLSTTRRCIYCLDTKAIEDFDREHVIPQSFGTFDSGTLVLNCVCRACNGALGRELDEKMARDSLEAIDRVAVGLKKAAEFKTLGRRSTLQVEFDKEGPLQGAIGYHIPDPAGGQTLAVSPIPQLGFAQHRDGPFKWFPLHLVPTKSEMRERYDLPPDAFWFVKAWGIKSRSDVQDELERHGFNRGNFEEEVEPPTGRMKTEIVATISDPDYRAAAKVAFNYLTSLGGAEFALQPQFNEIRRFIRDGVKLPWASVRPLPNPWVLAREDATPLIGHYVVIRTRGDEIECDVCLLMRTRYRIKLAVGGFVLPVTVNGGHLFDVQNRSAHRIRAQEFPLD